MIEFKSTVSVCRLKKRNAEMDLKTHSLQEKVASFQAEFSRVSKRAVYNLN